MIQQTDGGCQEGGPEHCQYCRVAGLYERQLSPRCIIIGAENLITMFAMWEAAAKIHMGDDGWLRL